MWNMYLMRTAGTRWRKSHLALPHVQTRTCARRSSFSFACASHTSLRRTHVFATAPLKANIRKNSHGRSIFALMSVRDARDVCSEGPSLGAREPSSVHQVATEQLWRISVLRSAEWGRGVLGDVFLVSLRQSGFLSNILRKVFFFAPPCLPASLIVVSSSRDLALPTAARSSPRAANRYRAYRAAASRSARKQKKTSTFAVKLPSTLLRLNGLRSLKQLLECRYGVIKFLETQ